MSGTHLNSLSVITKNVHPNDRLVKLWVGALDNVVIQMFLIPQSVHALEYEFKESLQVLGAWTRDKNVGVTMSERGGDSKSKSSGFSSSSRSSQGDGRRKRLLGDSIDEGEDSLGLIEGLGQLDEFPDILCIEERFFQIGQF